MRKIRENEILNHLTNTILKWLMIHIAIQYRFDQSIRMNDWTSWGKNGRKIIKETMKHEAIGKIGKKTICFQNNELVTF